MLIGGETRRVVVDGRVLGVGDLLDEGEVAAIERGVVRVRWRGRDLTYDLGDVWPREYRAEAARRAAASGGTPPEESKR